MNIIALLAAFGFLCFYALTAAAVTVWVPKNIIGAIRWLQERQYD